MYVPAKQNNNQRLINTFDTCRRELPGAAERNLSNWRSAGHAACFYQEFQHDLWRKSEISQRGLVLGFILLDSELLKATCNELLLVLVGILSI